MKRKLVSAITSAIVGLGLLAGAKEVSAVLQWQLFQGNDCPEAFGEPKGGFDTCSVNGSPIIVKFETDAAGIEVNTMFPTIDGSEFLFDPPLSNSISSGNWTYTPNDAEDPSIRYWVAKAGNQFNLFWDGTLDPNSATVQFNNIWFTPEEKDLSHLGYYDTGSVAVVPEPSTLLLLGSGLLALNRFTRRFSRKAA